MLSSAPALADGSAPPGNNGFVQLNGLKPPQEPSNEPHLPCVFALEFFGYDDIETNNAHVQIDLQPPTGTANLVDETFTFSGERPPGREFNHSQPYDLTDELAGYEPHPQQGYHVQFTVTVDGVGAFRAPDGTPAKHKTVWIEECEPAPVETELVVCKVAGDDTTIGREFSFTIDDGTAFTAVADGDCVTQQVPAGLHEVVELAAEGFELTDVAVVPAAAETETEVARGVEVDVPEGETVTVTFTNEQEVDETELIVCKVAGDAATVGEEFSFTIDDGTAFTAVADGDCVTQQVPAGLHEVVELAAEGFELTDVAVVPAAAETETEVARGVEVDVAEGETVTVTFTNEQEVDETELIVCKVAGDAGTVGEEFDFTVLDDAGATVAQLNDVQAAAAPGTCVTREVEPGEYDVVEAAAAGFRLTSVAVSPSDAGTTDAANRRASVELAEGDNVRVTFTNAEEVVFTPASGTLRVCKAAGDDATEGEAFSFRIDNGSVFPVVADGPCATRTVTPGAHQVVEAAAEGFDLTDIAVEPTSAGSGNEETRTASVNVARNQVVTVTFTNEAETGVLPGELERDLAIEKLVDRTSVMPGQMLEYTLVITNEGTADIANFVVRDVLPSELTLVEVFGEGFDCVGTRTVECTYQGTLAAGADPVMIGVSTIVAVGARGVIENIATVPLENDVNPADNVAEVRTPVIPVVTPQPPAVQPPQPDTQVLPDTVVRPAPVRAVQTPQTLPFTGSETSNLLTSALALMLFGMIALGIGMRRPRRYVPRHAIG